MDNIYNDPEYGETLAGKQVRIEGGCPSLNVSGVIERIQVLNNEVIYMIMTDHKARTCIGANHPGLSIILVE